MDGIIITEKHPVSDILGRNRWIFAPTANIRFNATHNGRGFTINAFRTDGYHQSKRDKVTPMSQHIVTAYEAGVPFSIPDDLVAFALESERLRQESVNVIVDSFRNAIECNDKSLGFADFLSSIGEHSEIGAHEAQEDEIGRRIFAILPNPFDTHLIREH